MAKTVQRQNKNTIAMAYLQKNQSKGSSLQRISITNKFVWWPCKYRFNSWGKGAILPLNKSLFDCFDRNSNSKRRIHCCCFDTVFLGYLRIVLRLWIGHGQNGANAGQEDNCNGLFVEKSEWGIKYQLKMKYVIRNIIETYKKLHNVRCFFKWVSGR